MDSIRFDPSKGLEENVRSFLEALAEEDSEMAGILRDHLPVLLSAKDETARRERISEFNEKVTVALDSLQSPSDEEASE